MAGRGAVRIALVTDWFLPRLGGIELHLADLARALEDQHHDVEVLTPTPGPATIDGIAVRRIDTWLMPGVGIAVSPTLVGRMRAELATGTYDIVHVHISVVSPVGYAAIVAARALNLPTVVTFHSVLLGATRLLGALDRLLRWSSWPLEVSGVSTLVAGQLRRSAAGLAVSVLPNGIDPRRWRPPAATPTHDSDTIVAVTAMRLHRKKRPLPLLRAYRRARDIAAARQRRLVLSIAGEGPERPGLERYIRRYRLDDVTLLGAQPRAALADLYATADLFVLPSIRESFGIAALEARCAGLPVITMVGSGAVEFLRHEETALLAGTDADFADAWARLALDDDLRRRLAPPDAGLDRFAWPAVVATHLASYERAMAAGGVIRPVMAPAGSGAAGA